MLYLLSAILTRHVLFARLLQCVVLGVLILVLFFAYRAWVAGPPTPVVPGSLKGHTVILFACSLSSLPLQLVEQLSRTGAQILIVLPSPISDPTNIQLVFLLRQLNPNIFLDQCDLRSPADCLRFTQKWVTTATTTPASVTTIPSNTTTLKLHAVIFLYKLSDPESTIRQNISISSPLIFIQTLLPYLLKTENPNYRLHPVRIIPIISPFHSLVLKKTDKDRWIDLEAKEARMARTVWKTFESSRASSSTPNSPLSPLVVLPVCPGYTRQDLSRAIRPRSSKWWTPLVMIFSTPLIWLLGRNAREAIQAILWVLFSPIESLGPGDVHQDRRKVGREEMLVDRTVLENEIERNEMLIRNLIKVKT